MTELSLNVRAPFATVVAATREALAEQGFGVLTEIDVTATMRAKLDAELEDYLILGACNPPLAHRALQADRQVGVFLPCNVVVRADPASPGDVVVEAVDPLGMVAAAGEASDALAAVAADADQRLRAAVAAVAVDLGGSVPTRG